MTPGFGQFSSVNAALEGAVADSAGGRMPAVTIKVRDTATRRTREGSTNAEGFFRISELPPGVYEVLVSQPGFAPYHHAGVSLQLGSTAHLDIVLQSGGVTTQITVTAQPPALEPTQTSVSS